MSPVLGLRALMSFVRAPALGCLVVLVLSVGQVAAVEPKGASMVCALARTLDDGSIQPDRVEKHDACDWAPLALWAFKDVRTAAEAVCVLAFESGAQTEAATPRTAADGTTDWLVGLFQINHDDLQGTQRRDVVRRWEYLNGWSTPRLVEWLQVPFLNASVAADVHSNAGWAPWDDRVERSCGLR